MVRDRSHVYAQIFYILILSFYLYSIHVLKKLNISLDQHPNTTTCLGGGWAVGRFVAVLWGRVPARTGDLPPHDVTMLVGVAAAEELLGPGSAGSALT